MFCTKTLKHLPVRKLKVKSLKHHTQLFFQNIIATILHQLQISLHNYLRMKKTKLVMLPKKQITQMKMYIYARHLITYEDTSQLRTSPFDSLNSTSIFMKLDIVISKAIFRVN